MCSSGIDRGELNADGVNSEELALFASSTGAAYYASPARAWFICRRDTFIFTYAGPGPMCWPASRSY